MDRPKHDWRSLVTMTLASKVRYGQRHQCSVGKDALSTPLKKARNRFKLRKENVKTFVGQGQDTGQDAELVAEPVAELAGHFHISANQVLLRTAQRSETTVADVAA